MEQSLHIGEIPALLLGESAPRLFLFIHGQCGCKEDARGFAEVACPLGWQVLSIDLPQHGTRLHSQVPLDPWHVVPELRQVMAYARASWEQIALYANSIGCWFSLLTFADEPLERCLFLCPLVDMERMIQGMMQGAGVTEEQLEREKLHPVPQGQTLSWDYLTYVRTHPLTRWTAPTFVLRAPKDTVIDADTVQTFCQRFSCALTLLPDGAHWLHTPQELAWVRQWEAAALQASSAASLEKPCACSPLPPVL